MASELHFELVSPETLLYNKHVALVTIPGEDGDFGVLQGHVPLIASIRPGVLEVFDHENGPVTDRIFVAGGFAEVTNERCTILAEEALMVSELDRTQLMETASNLNDDIALAKTDHERAALEARLGIVKAKLAAIS